MEFDTVSFLIGIVGGVVVSYGIIYWISGLLIERLKADETAEFATDDDKRIEMKVERYHEVLYAFRTDNNDFVCQGVDLKELKLHFLQRFPQYEGYIVDTVKELQEELARQDKELTNEISNLQ
jgi:hypothetical protein